MWGHTVQGDVPRPRGAPDNPKALEIGVATFCVSGNATSFSYAERPDGGISCQGWAVGWGRTPIAPIYVREFALLHGCVLAMQAIRQRKEKGRPWPTVSYLRAGDHVTCAKLLDWLNGGVQEFASSAGPK